MDKPGSKEEAKPDDVEKPKPDASKNGKEEKPEPKEGSPRWNEVYRKMNDFKREKEELAKDLDALRRHSREMAENLEKINKQKADKPKMPTPNPAEDPEGYAAWHELQLAEKEKQFEEIRRKDKEESMLMFMNAMYDDYEDMAVIAERDMEKDQKLRDEIYSKPNPWKAAYQYGKKKKSDSAPANPIDVENGGDIPPSGNDDNMELRDDEMRVAKNLWPGMPTDKVKEKYLEHKKALGIGGRK